MGVGAGNSSLPGPSVENLAEAIRERTKGGRCLSQAEIIQIGVSLRLTKPRIRGVVRQLLQERILVDMALPGSRQRKVVHRENLGEIDVVFEGELQHAEHQRSASPPREPTIFEGTARLFVRNVCGRPLSDVTLSPEGSEVLFVQRRSLESSECAEFDQVALAELRHGILTDSELHIQQAAMIARLADAKLAGAPIRRVKTSRFFLGYLSRGRQITAPLDFALLVGAGQWISYSLPFAPEPRALS